MEKQIRVMYGGRCAEKVLLGDISNGASNDLEKATDLAYCMVMNFGMTDDSFLVKITNRPDFNNHIENQSIKKIEEICEKAYQETLEIVSINKLVISKLAALLMDKEYLSDVEISAFLNENNIVH